MDEQMTLWEMIYPKFKFNGKPIILLEMFAGIGAQRKSLENLGLKIDDEKSKICEWAYNSILAYNAIHIKDFIDYSNGLEKETMLEKIKGISINYNEALSEKQLKAKSIEWVKKAYNNIVATHDLIDISNVKGKDLGDLPKDQVSILTYSYPCQSLSLAGKREGMGEGTRSGLLWQVERILLEREREQLNMPNILLLENVPEAIGTGNKDLFSKWQNQLEKMGYSNYVKILNAKDYGIPQNRKRVFMVSILGDYAYSFPHKIKLECHLKDLLEKNVDEKYYLTDKHIERISNWKAQQKSLENMRNNILISPTLTARGAGEDHSGMVLINTELFQEGEVVDFGSSDKFRREHSTGETPSLLTHPKLAIVEKDNDESNRGGIPIVEATKKGYKVAQDGDGVDISGRMQYHRGTVQKGLAQTLKTDCDVGVVVEDEEES